MGVSVDTRCIWKKPEEYERDVFYFLSKYHPCNLIYLFIYLSIYSVPDMYFSLEIRKCKTHPALGSCLVEQTDVNRQVCKMLGESHLWSGVEGQEAFTG